MRSLFLCEVRLAGIRTERCVPSYQVLILACGSGLTTFDMASASICHVSGSVRCSFRISSMPMSLTILIIGMNGPETRVILGNIRRIVKNGRAYLYENRSYRDQGKVKQESRYLGIETEKDGQKTIKTPKNRTSVRKIL